MIRSTMTRHFSLVTALLLLMTGNACADQRKTAPSSKGSLVVEKTEGGVIAKPAADELVVQVLSRALDPGELVRIVARTGAPLAKVDGTLRGDALDFIEDPDSGSWFAWAALDLDWKPGPVPLVVSATTREGGQLDKTQDVSVGAKSFPVSELKVESKYVNPPKDVQARIEREQALLATVYARRSTLPPPHEVFLRPVTGEPTSVFGARRVFNGEKRAPHPGLDLRAATGTAVQCTGPGQVALARDLYFSGNTVVVDHGGGLFTVYAHLSRIDAKEDATIVAGDSVGLSGATGRVTGPHLHWGGKLGKRVFDPTSLLASDLFPASH